MIYNLIELNNESYSTKAAPTDYANGECEKVWPVLTHMRLLYKTLQAHFALISNDAVCQIQFELFELLTSPSESNERTASDYHLELTCIP